MESSFIDDILEEFGKTAIKVETDKIDVIPTGSLSLDVSTGVGGIPRGKYTEIYGSEGGGKTTLALSIVKEALLQNLKALYIDAEHMLDYRLLKDMLGKEFNTESFVILNPKTAEDAFTMMESGINSGNFAVIILDSIGALAPKKEQDDEFADANVGLIARMLTKFLRRNVHTIEENNIAIILLNQVRDKIGAFYPTFTTPGGHALKHFACLRISLSKSEDLKIGKEIVGITTKFVIKKNKLSAPFRSYILPIIFGKGIDSFSDAVDFCSMIGVIKKKGSFYKFEDIMLGQGKLAAGDFLSKNPEILDKIREMVYNVLNNYTSIDIEAINEELYEEKEKEKDE